MSMSFARIFRREFSPPIRGLYSKRKRIRKKAQKRRNNLPLDLAMREPNPLLARLKPDTSWQGSSLHDLPLVLPPQP
jgi:hypothetical protein